MSVTYSKRLENMHVELIQQLYHELRQSYHGFSIRNKEYIKWLCDKNPFFAGIFTIRLGNVPIGFAIISLKKTKEIYYDLIEPPQNKTEVESSHEDLRVLNVEDICISLKKANGELYSHLISNITDYARQIGADEVRLWTYGRTTPLYDACVRKGYVAYPSPIVNINIVDKNFLRFLVRSLEEKPHANKLSNKSNEIIKIILCSKGISNNSEAIFLKISKDGIEATTDYLQPTIVIEAKKNSLYNLIFGKSAPLKEVIFSSIRIKPIWKIQFAIQILKHLSINKSWYVPFCDTV